MTSHPKFSVTPTAPTLAPTHAHEVLAHHTHHPAATGANSTVDFVVDFVVGMDFVVDFVMDPPVALTPPFTVLRQRRLRHGLGQERTDTLETYAKYSRVRSLCWRISGTYRLVPAQ